MKNTSIEVWQKQISPVLKQAEALQITGPEEMKGAVELLSKLNQFNDKITAEKERVTKPLNEALKAERSRWKPVELVNQEAIGIIRAKMTGYQTAEMRRQMEEEEKIASRVGEGKGKFKIETAVRKLDEVQKTEKEVATEAGLVQFVETKKFEVVNLALVPIEYHLANEMMIRQAMKQGKELPGVKYWVESVPRNYR